MDYTARRVKLNVYTVHAPDSTLVGEMSFPNGLRIWPADGAPLTPAVRALNMEAFPVFNIRGRNLHVTRKLLTDKFFFNHFDMQLVDGAQPVLTMQFRPPSFDYVIEHRNERYVLRRHSLFAFRFSLLDKNGSPLAAFRDTTPFWSLRTSQRDFLLKTTKEIDETLLCYAFWFSVTTFYA